MLQIHLSTHLPHLPNPLPPSGLVLAPPPPGSPPSLPPAGLRVSLQCQPPLLTQAPASSLVWTQSPDVQAPAGLLAPSPNQRRNHLSSPPVTWPPATVEEGTQRRHSSCWKLPSRELPTLWAPSLRLSPVGPCLHPPPPPLLVGLSTCPPRTSPGGLCLENQQEVSFAWTGGDWCCWQQAEGPPGAAAWPLSLVLTHGLALGPLDCVARALHVLFAQASAPRITRSAHGQAAWPPPARPQDRAAAPPSSQQLPSSPSPLLNLTPDQPLLVESLPIWVHSCKAPPAPLEFPALHFRSRPPAQITARRVEGAPRTHFLRFDTESNLPERNRLDSQGISLVVDSTRPRRVSENPPGPECWIPGLC